MRISIVFCSATLWDVIGKVIAYVINGIYLEKTRGCYTGNEDKHVELSNNSRKKAREI